MTFQQWEDLACGAWHLEDRKIQEITNLVQAYSIIHMHAPRSDLSSSTNNRNRNRVLLAAKTAVPWRDQARNAWLDDRYVEVGTGRRQSCCWRHGHALPRGMSRPSWIRWTGDTVASLSYRYISYQFVRAPWRSPVILHCSLTGLHVCSRSSVAVAVAQHRMMCPARTDAWW